MRQRRRAGRRSARVARDAERRLDRDLSGCARWHVGCEEGLPCKHDVSGGRAHRARRRRAPCRLLEQSWNRGRQRRARLSAQDWHRHAAGSDRRDGAHAGRFVRRQPWRAQDVRPRAGERKGGRGRRRHARLHAERRRVRGRRMERGRGRRGLRRRLSGADVAEQLAAVLPLVRARADDARQGRGALDSRRWSSTRRPRTARRART